MNQWAKLHAKVAESEDFMALHCADPNAALLFLMSLPQAVPWGILPATPALFRARVCPMLDISLDQVKTCLKLIVDQGCFTAYEDRHGKPLVYITNWNENQGRQWDRVAAPQYDLPPGWTPPAGLAKGLEDAAKRGRRLTPEAIEERLVDAESKTSLRRVLDQSQTGLAYREERGESRKGNTNARARARATAPAATVVVPETVADSTPPEPPNPPRQLTEQQAAIESLWTTLGLSGKPGPGKGGKPPYSAVAGIVAEHGLPMISEYETHCRSSGLTLPAGAAPWPWFVRNLREAMNQPWKWRDNGNGSGGRGPQIQLTELDRMQIQADREREEASRRGN